MYEEKYKVIKKLTDLHRQLADVYKQSDAAKEFIELEERYHTLVESLPIGIYYSDLFGKLLYGNIL